ncbi:MAG TPA: HAMP domain-containing histidine kinase [Rhodospirillales bacterium]|nr:HAMP domain-containing histidine kinase [Rhodospirillales bacterium]
MSRTLLAPRSWPLAVKVPLVVAALMAALGVLASWLVLANLADIQERNLRRLADVTLGTLAASLAAPVERRDIWETFDALDRLTATDSGMPAVAMVVLLPGGEVLAASDPRRFPTLRRLDEPLLRAALRAGDMLFDTSRARAVATYRLEEGGEQLGTLLAELDIGALLAERRRATVALVVSNSFLTLVMAGVGYALVRRMLGPLSRLAVAAERLERGEDPGELLEPPQGSREFRKLFGRFRAMARAVQERETILKRLAEEDRLAQLGRLASAMAHEVNNPLAGLLTVVDTLRRRGEDDGVRRHAVELLERGLLGIRNVVGAMLVAYKEDREAPGLTRRAIDDLRYLVQHEVARKRLELVWTNRLPPVLPVDGGAVRQALLNLLLNACGASPVGGKVVFEAVAEDGVCRFLIADQGPGLPADMAAILERSGPPTTPPGRGLGLWTAATLWQRIGGTIRVERVPGKGTRIRLAVPVRVRAEVV